MLTLEKNGLKLVLTVPGAYYRGTRFDHAGVFRKIEKDNRPYADEWFPVYDPLKHDAVCGPSEEFGEIGFDTAAPGDSFLKIGVGWLRRPDTEPYDRFRLYEIVDEGQRTLERTEECLVFRQVLDAYDYVKTVRILSSACFEIAHTLRNTGRGLLRCTHYNHNFFTLDHQAIGAEREIDFPFRPDGHWRSAYDHVHLTGSGIRFTGPVSSEGPSVFMGDLHAPAPVPIDFRVRDRESGLGVHVQGDRPFTHMVFWANGRVACIEPYILLEMQPGDTITWTLRYGLEEAATHS